MCEQLAQGCYLGADQPRFEPATFWVASEPSTVMPHRPLRLNFTFKSNNHHFYTTNINTTTWSNTYDNSNGFAMANEVILCLPTIVISTFNDLRCWTGVVHCMSRDNILSVRRPVQTQDVCRTTTLCGTSTETIPHYDITQWHAKGIFYHLSTAHNQINKKTTLPAFAIINRKGVQYFTG